ncbi:hypothetical protein GXM_03344 [Nostoc sphaeroides CCNUC1]|uniref:Uncharacterized protein n=1 Tax=Nostoc sphaeroides CCNUC1 TaxID=2653204 RepID=A0A5P8VZK2_9NOSO|nr:hypothetical protein GXM_03344 [Nostoc sphaeroides CCNUC1]
MFHLLALIYHRGNVGAFTLSLMAKIRFNFEAMSREWLTKLTLKL